MSHHWPEGEGPVLPEEARARFRKALDDPRHKPTGKDDPRLEATIDDSVPEGGHDDEED